MAAVLQGVVDDLRGSVFRRAAGYGSPTNLGRRRAAAYVASRDREWPFSFENLCEALGLDSDLLRRELGKVPVRADVPTEGVMAASLTMRVHESTLPSVRFSAVDAPSAR